MARRSFRQDLTGHQDLQAGLRVRKRPSHLLGHTANSRCSRLKSEFETMEVKQQTYTLLFDSFTPKTYVLVISTHQELCERLALNLSRAAHSLVYAAADLARIKQAIAKAKPVFAELPGVSLAGR